MQTAGSKWYRACLETTERDGRLLCKAAFQSSWVFVLQGVPPKMCGQVPLGTVGCGYNALSLRAYKFYCAMSFAAGGRRLP
jgi:hypothetical protein